MDAAEKDRLQKLDGMCESLLTEQRQLSEKLNALREGGDTKSHRFRELMGQKLMNAGLIELLEKYGLM